MSSLSADPPRSRDDFEVAIICALQHEANAVIDVFDKHWDDKMHTLRPSRGEDRNEYTFGRIGLHDVVVVVLPGMGKQEASSAAAAMHPTFRNIQLGLVVGVCAVTPYTASGERSEILLGDVVVSTHVIQSDLGRQYDDAYIRKDTIESNLGRPTLEIRKILTHLELRHHHQQLEKRLQAHLEKLQSRNDVYAYPGMESDHLYAADYTHMHRLPEMCSECEEVKGAPDHVCAMARSASCADLGCDMKQLIQRERFSRPNDGDRHTSVWFGRLASGDQVLKSAAHRDRLHVTEKVIGFEMEGSGAWEHFPTVIIKSGCDYADSHKNKTWQNYCAGSAAACTKAFLQEWRKKERKVDLVDALGRTQIHPRKPPGPRVLPLRSSNPLFLGRAAELAELEQNFSTCPSESGMTPKVIVVQGLGGSGKSELCLRYLNMHDQRYWAIFWVDGSTDNTLGTGFERIAKQLNLASDDIAGVRYNLAAQEQPWLLIIDNADDPELDLSPYLPDQGRGHVLVTTRNPELDVYQTESTLNIGSLTDKDTLALLFKAARIPPQEQTALKSGAEDIIRILGSHTLSIIQAGAYIRRSRDMNGFIRIFNEQRKRVLEYCTPQARPQYGSVYATFEVSASRLQQDAVELQEQSASDALELLRLFAFMDRRGYFERIFSNARNFVESCTALEENTPVTNQNIADFDDKPAIARKHSSLLSSLAYESNDLDGKYRWREACNNLHRYSLLSFEKDENEDEILTFHPVVLAWALARQSKDEYQQSWLSVAATLLYCDPYHRYHSQLGNHNRVCAGHVSIDWWTDQSSLPFIILLYQLAWNLRYNGDQDVNVRVCQCLEVGLETMERQQSELSSGQEFIQYFIGSQACNMGDYGKSIQLLEHVVKVQEDSLAETHPRRFLCQSQLAQAYSDNKQPQKAVQLLESVLEAAQRTLAETDPDRLFTQHSLAVAYDRNMQTQKAIQLLEHTIEIKERVMDKTDSSLLSSQHSLALAYRSNGQTQKHVQLLQHIVEVEGQILMETDPHRLTSQQALAMAYDNDFRYQNAVQLLKHVMKMQEQTLAETHPSRLDTKQRLATVHSNNGQTQEAVQLLETVVEVRARTLAETHRDRLHSEAELAFAYQRNGQFQESVHLLEKAVEIRAQTLAETHPTRLGTEMELARAYRENEQTEEAVRLLEHVVAVQAQTLAETHRDRLYFAEELAIAYDANGQIEKAVQLQEHVVKVRAQTLAETDPVRTASEGWLSDFQEQLPSPEEEVPNLIESIN